MGNLDGKVVFVTGASSGIGKATARVLTQHGASVVIAARREEESQELVGELQASGAKIDFINQEIRRPVGFKAYRPRRAIFHHVVIFGSARVCA